MGYILGFDARFPNQNQTKHCWQNYVDYHKCILAKGEDFPPCRQVRSFPHKYISDHIRYKHGARHNISMTRMYGADMMGVVSFSWLTDRFAHRLGARSGMTSVVRYTINRPLCGRDVDIQAENGNFPVRLDQ